MKTILKTNNHVHLNWVEYILSKHEIEYFVMDRSMSSAEGNITAIPIRIVVKCEDEKNAVEIIRNEQNELDLKNKI